MLVVTPALDLADGRVATRREGLAVVGDADADPLDLAREVVRAGARALHVVDLDGARTGTYVNLPLAAAIARAVEVPVQLGGSICDPAVAHDALKRGLARVVFGSAIFGEPRYVDEVAALGPAALLALEIEDDRLRPRGGDAFLAERVQGTDAVEHARDAAARGVGRFYVVDVEADGRLGGPPLRFITRLREALGTALVELHVGGGVRDLLDVRDLATAGVRSVVVGRALQEGRLDLAEAQRVADDLSR